MQDLTAECLHAINAETGKEEWGFIPPFVGALLPQIVNKGYDGNVDSTTIVTRKMMEQKLKKKLRSCRWHKSYFWC